MIVPRENKIKINTDAAIFETFQHFSYSMIAINHFRELVDAVFKCLHGSLSPEVAESLGIREALSWIKKKQWRQVEMETYSLVSV